MNETGNTGSAPRVTEEKIKANIIATHYQRLDSHPHFTICVISMKNGFAVIGQSAPVSPANFDQRVGEELAYRDAFSKLWALEGYVLATELSRQPVADNA